MSLGSPHDRATVPAAVCFSGRGAEGFTAESAQIALAYRLRPGDGLSVLRLVLAFLFGGLLATEFAVLIEAPLVTFVLAQSSHASLIASSLAGVIEEACKIAAVIVVARGLAVRNARTGLFLGGAVGLGFAAFEDMRYAAAAIAEPFLGQTGLSSIAGVTFGRDFLGPFEHPVFTSLIASVLFAATRNGRFRITWRVVAVYLAVAFSHGLIDALPGLLGLSMSADAANNVGEVLSLVVVFAGAIVWFIYARRLKRRTLAEEAVLPSAEPVEAGPIGPLPA